MTLIKMFPELNSKTIWQHIPSALATLVFKELSYEAQFGALPDDSFYKRGAIRVVKNAQKSFVEAQ